MRTVKFVDRLAERLERAERLDAVSDRLGSLIRSVIRPGPVEDALSGTPSGHPLHPPLVVAPLGSWVLASVLDARADADSARTLVGLGCLAALPAAAAGATDWLSTQGAERRVGVAHALLNDAALSLYGASWLARRRGRSKAGAALSAVGLGVLLAAGWLGGHLVYAQGVGVDTTAFQQVPTAWTDAGDAAELPDEGELRQVTAAGVPLLVVKRGGVHVAMLDRCTHRGGPLSDGELTGDCVVCPWHGSAFVTSDGSVAAGPATRPQALVDLRVRDGRIEVRRDEPRTLRSNPVGV